MSSSLKKLLQVARNDLVIIFLGFAAVGWLFSLQGIHFSLWLFLHGVIAYLSWAGLGAVVLSSIVITIAMWIATLSTSSNIGNLPTLPMLTTLNTAQIWALNLALSWFLTTFLTFQLAHLVQSIDSVGMSKSTRFLIAVLTALLGLHLGRLFESKTIFG